MPLICKMYHMCIYVKFSVFGLHIRESKRKASLLESLRMRDAQKVGFSALRRLAVLHTSDTGVFSLRHSFPTPTTILENEHVCSAYSISMVVGCPLIPPSHHPEIEHACSLSMVVICSSSP